MSESVAMRRKSGDWKALILGLTFAVLATSVWAQPIARTGVPKPANNFRNEATLIKVIRDGYDRLSAFTRAGEAPLRFQLSDFTTLPLEEFDTVYWADVVTPPGGAVIDVARERYEGPEGRQLGVRYVPVWNELESYLETSEGMRIRSMKLSEVLAQAMLDDETLAGVTAMTSFNVEVLYEGQVRNYRAMYLWIDENPADDGTLEFHVIDHIVQGVSESYGDPLELAKSEKQIQELRAVYNETPAPGLQSKLLPNPCEVAEYGSRTTDAYFYTTTGHINGGHGPFATIRFACPCSLNCSQQCVPSLGFNACQEAGDTTKCHRLSSPSFAASFGFSQAGMPPPGCKLAMACSWKACLGCLCGTPSVSVGVSGSGLSAGFSYTASPDAAAIISFEAPHSCVACEPEPQNSPILLDLDGGGFHLTGVENAVSFDFDGDGNPEQTTWTAGGGDAFVALDRNGNGVVDDATEMFGNFTDQPALAEEPNGYLALAVFDLAENGGDGNGWIDSADAVYADLRLWADANHDGVSQASELWPLADSGVEAIGLDYRESRRSDRHGNRFRYAGLAKMANHRTIQTVDVFFLEP